MLLTSPLVATLGTTLTVPSALVVDWLMHDAHFQALYVTGAFSVLTGFILATVRLDGSVAPTGTGAHAASPGVKEVSGDTAVSV
jgi:drug/metabolite transporter (DMT)-like permease